MRARILVPLAALAMLAGACASVPGDAVATVNGQTIGQDRFERIVSAQVANIGMRPRDAEVAQRAIDAGIVDRAALHQALIAELEPLSQGQPSRITAGPPVHVPQEFVDELFAQQVGDEDEPDATVDELGVTADRFRDVFERWVRFEARGLWANQNRQDGSFRTDFSIDRSQQLAGLQQNVIQQLVQAEITRQAVAELDIEVSEDTVAQIKEQIVGQFPDDDALQAALDDVGYTREDFEELVVRSQARQQALQQVQDPAQIQAFFEDLDVDVATRFGRWDEQQGTVVAPANEL